MVGRRALLRGSLGAATAVGGAAAAAPVAAQSYDGWFDDVENYDATVDLRGNDEVTVAVGAGDDGLFFDPPAILVDPGTTVVWEWTGEGGGHNVVHEPAEGENPVFESDIVSEAGYTFEHTFDDTEEAVYRYYCAPHLDFGMKGAVAVGAVDDEVQTPSGGAGGGEDQPLTITDTAVLGFGIVIVAVLLLAVVRPGLFDPEGY